MSVMRMVDGSGWSMKFVDGVMSMGMMSVVEMVISCNSFLYVRYLFWLFVFSGFYSFWFMVMVVIGFFNFF